MKATRLVACALVVSVSVFGFATVSADEGEKAAAPSPKSGTAVPVVVDGSNVASMSRSPSWMNLSGGAAISSGSLSAVSNAPVSRAEVLPLQAGPYAPVSSGSAPLLSAASSVPNTSLTLAPAKPTNLAASPTQSLALGQTSPQLILLGDASDTLQPTSLSTFESSSVMPTRSDAQQNTWTRGAGTR